MKTSRARRRCKQRRRAHSLASASEKTSSPRLPHSLPTNLLLRKIFAGALSYEPPREKSKKTFAFPLKNGAQCSIIVVYCKGTVRTTLFRRGKTRLAGIRQSRPPRLFRLPLLFAKFYIVKFCEGCGINCAPCRSSSLQYGGIAASSSRQSISKSTRQKCKAIKSCGFAPRQGKGCRPCRAHGQGP